MRIAAILVFVTTLVYSQETINLPVPVARDVVKELIDKDKYKEQLKNSEEIVRLLEQKMVVKDTIIDIHEKKEINYLKQVDTEKQKTELWRTKYEDVYRNYVIQKNVNKYQKYIVGGLAIVLGVTLLN